MVCQIQNKSQFYILIVGFHFLSSRQRSKKEKLLFSCSVSPFQRTYFPFIILYTVNTIQKGCMTELSTCYFYYVFSRQEEQWKGETAKCKFTELKRNRLFRGPVVVFRSQLTYWNIILVWAAWRGLYVLEEATFSQQDAKLKWSSLMQVHSNRRAILTWSKRNGTRKQKQSTSVPCLLLSYSFPPP